MRSCIGRNTDSHTALWARVWVPRSAPRYGHAHTLSRHMSPWLARCVHAKLTELHGNSGGHCRYPDAHACVHCTPGGHKH